MEVSHKEYLAMLVAKEQGRTMAEILHLGHSRPDLGHEDQAFKDRPPPGHVWCRDSLRVWLGSTGCRREGLEEWKLRRRGGKVRISRTLSIPN